jgi:hypothetical protein
MAFIPILPPGQPRPTSLELGAATVPPSATNLQPPPPVTHNQDRGNTDVLTQPYAPLPGKKTHRAAIILAGVLAVWFVILLGAILAFGGMNGTSPGSTGQPPSTLLPGLGIVGVGLLLVGFSVFMMVRRRN